MNIEKSLKKKLHKQQETLRRGNTWFLELPHYNIQNAQNYTENYEKKQRQTFTQEINRNSSRKHRY